LLFSFIYKKFRMSKGAVVYQNMNCQLPVRLSKRQEFPGVKVESGQQASISTLTCVIWPQQTNTRSRQPILLRAGFTVFSSAFSKPKWWLIDEMTIDSQRGCISRNDLLLFKPNSLFRRNKTHHIQSLVSALQYKEIRW
jgi:hypothetical protein